MHKLLKFHETDQKRPKGRVTLMAFEPGVIEGYLDKGHTLDEAIGLADYHGKCRQEIKVDNLVVNNGLGLMTSLLIGESSPLSYHAIGTGTTTPVSTDTELTTEVSRRPITYKISSGTTVILQTYFLAALSTYNLKEGGIYGGDASDTADSGTLFSHYLLEFDNSAGLSDLIFLYEVEMQP
jgi:hypothetical protein